MEQRDVRTKNTGVPQTTLRCFLDTEFIEAGRHRPIQLISIGIVTEDGREFYAESQEFDPKTVSPWLKENVLPHLGPVANRKPVALIAREVREFIGDAKPEFWGYYADYDWVIFCQMFGSMIDLPKGWPMYCRDIKQLCDSLGNPQLPAQESAEHNALSDAKWNKLAFQRLLSENGPKSFDGSGFPKSGSSSPATVREQMEAIRKLRIAASAAVRRSQLGAPIDVIGIGILEAALRDIETFKNIPSGIVEQPKKDSDLGEKEP